MRWSTPGRWPSSGGTSPSEVQKVMFFWIWDGKMAMDQYLHIPFLGGWTSIYQLFWCSPGVQGFDTLPNLGWTLAFSSLSKPWCSQDGKRAFGEIPSHSQFSARWKKSSATAAVLFALLRGGLGAVQLIRGGLDSPKNWGEILGFQSTKNRKVIVFELEETLPCCPFGMGQCFSFSISVGRQVLRELILPYIQWKVF